MTKGPKISIITACYNAEKTIEQTIQSVLSQTYENMEYIIVDGASTDGTMEIVTKYQDQIDVIVSEKDEGIYDAFNKGLKIASGEYIQYLNADDYLIKDNVISQIANFIINNNNAIIVYGGIVLKNEASGFFSLLNREIVYEEFQKGIMIPHPATFMKKDKMIEAGMFDTTYMIAADFDLTAKIYKKYKENVYYFPQLISLFRLGGISSELKNHEIKNAEVSKIVKKNFQKEYSQNKISNEKYLRTWLEKKIYEDINISNYLVENNISEVAIWGTGIVSNILVSECKKNNICIQVFIDNDVQKQGMQMNDIQIVSPEWLLKYEEKIDAIILGFEGSHEEAVTKQLNKMGIIKKIYSWRNLVQEM